MCKKLVTILDKDEINNHIWRQQCIVKLKGWYRYPKIHSCENIAGLFIKFLPRRTFEQMIHKFGLCHLNDVSLHEGRNIICDEQYSIKNIECCTLFPLLDFFISMGFF